MTYTLVKDANRQVPFSSGMMIQREEMRCMLMLKTLDKGSIVKSNGRVLVVNENNKGQYRLENVNKGTKKQSHSPSQNNNKQVKLTQREREILLLIAQGETVKSIAIKLGISERTVSVHVQHAKMKLGGCTLAGMVGSAYMKGVLIVECPGETRTNGKIEKKQFSTDEVQK